MKMAMLEILSSGSQSETLLMRRANIPWDEFRRLMHQLEKPGFVTRLLEEKWSRKKWTLSEKGAEAVQVWLRLSNLMGEEPLLKPMLIAW